MRRIILVAGIAFILLNLLPTRVLVINGQNIVQPPKTALNAKIVRIDPFYKPEHLSADFARDYVVAEARKANVNPAIADCLVFHESQYRNFIIGDKDFKGVSLGLWQINTYFHADVPSSTAFSMEKSTAWALKKIKKGHISWWATYKLYCYNFSVFIRNGEYPLKAGK